MNRTSATAIRIAKIYFALATGKLDWIYLTDIRAELADLSREEQDAALLWLMRGNTIEVDGRLMECVLAPDSSRARNYPGHVAAAYRGANWLAFQDAD
jgi:hypothetical protein